MNSATKKKTFCSGPVPAPNGASPSLPFPGAGAKKKNTLGGVFFWLWPRAGFQRGFSFPCLSPGPQQKKKHPGWCFFLLFSFPCLSPGPEQKQTHPGWCVFFCSGPAESSRRPTERNKKKKHFAHPGPTAKNFLETNDAGHEQKGATTKKKHPGHFLDPLGGLGKPYALPSEPNTP